MILEYLCKNFRSIKDEIVFSMLASKDTSMNEELLAFNSLSILRMATILGPNGSGKSNFIKSFESLVLLIKNSYTLQPGDFLPNYKHKLSSDEPTEYKVHFVNDGIRYFYFVSYKDVILEEKLYYYPNGKKTILFERTNNKLNFGSNNPKNFHNAIEAMNANPIRLFISCAANLNDNEFIKSAFLFFKEKVVFYPHIPNNWREYTAEQIISNSKFKNRFISFLQSIDISVQDVNAKLNEFIPKAEDLSSLPPEFRGFFVGKKVNSYDININHGQFILNLNEESNGIKKLFEVLCPIFKIIEDQKILFWDEFEVNLHPDIVYQIVKIFKQLDINNLSQFIFTTHFINVLDLDIMRRDQIWFTEIEKENLSTILFSLAEVKNVRKEENIQKGYLQNRYGGVPIIDSNKIYKLIGGTNNE